MTPQAICWPLGLAASRTEAAHCLQQRTAWTLDGTAPPTLPDRVNSASLLETAWVDPRRGQRLRPGCPTTGPARGAPPLQPVTYARWPTLLQPWVDSDQRSEVERLPLGPPCRGQVAPSQSLRIAGLDAHTVVRATPGRAVATVSLQVLGTTEPVHWLLDGQLVGTTQAAPAVVAGPRQPPPEAAMGTERPGPALRLALTRPGTHALTAMDSSGRYGQLMFSVR